MKILALLTILSVMLFSDIKVITSEKNGLTSISYKELSDLYLGKTNSIKGIKVTPIDNKDSYKEFYKKVIKKTPKQFRAYWLKQIYTTKKQPPKKLSKQEIVKLLKINSKVISYSSNKLTGKIICRVK